MSTSSARPLPRPAIRAYARVTPSALKVQTSRESVIGARGAGDPWAGPGDPSPFALDMWLPWLPRLPRLPWLLGPVPSLRGSHSRMCLPPPPSSHACDARRAPWAPPATADGTNRSPPSPSMVRASFCVAAAPHRLQAKPLHVLAFDWRPRGGRLALLPILSEEERRLLPPRPGRWSPLGFEERRRRVGR